MIDQLIRTPLTELVGVRHPVVQTGMGWVAGPRLVTATANAGGASREIDAAAPSGAVDEATGSTEAPTGTAAFVAQNAVVRCSTLSSSRTLPGQW